MSTEEQIPNAKVERIEGEDQADECASIKDPVRKALCKVCGVPVIGEAPFCKDHEPPVP